jgi:hypothetical protein
VDELRVRLSQLCEQHGIHRFEPEEIIELLEDGEAADWIVGQVMPEKDPAEVAELAGLLAEIAAAVGPVSLEEEAEGPAPDDDGATPAPTEAGVGEMPGLDQLAGMELPPGVDQEQVRQLLDSPQGEMLNDFGAFCQERGVDAEAGGEGMEDTLRELHDEWLQTPRDSLDGRKPADAMEGGRLFPQKVETYRREAPKVGRNSPCPCGSGKKYKKCCGREA